MTKRAWFTAAWAMAAALVMTAATARAQSGAGSVEAFYKGKQLRLVIGSPVGDSNDIWGRLMLRYMTGYIPGNPTGVPQNMPGGGTLIAANYLYNIAPKDGSHIGVFSRNIPTQAVLNRPNANFDPRKFGWLGSPELVNRVCTVWHDSAIKSAADLFDKELIVGGTGAGTAPTFMPTVYSKVLGMKFKVVEGYKGGADVFLAMERREVDGICLSFSQLKGPRAEWLAEGKLRVLFNTETTPLLGYPEVPTIYKFVKTEEQRQTLAFLNSAIEFGRPFTAPPELPADRLAALRAAFLAVTKDKGFLEDATKLKYDVTYSSGEHMLKLVQGMYATPREVIDRAADMMPAGGD